MKSLILSIGLLALLAGTQAHAQDADGDGVLDPNDNCLNTPNASQTDTNFDGFGNACDADYWNDGLVEEVDYEIFIKAFGSSTGQPNFNPDVDSNDDGVIGIPDFQVISIQFGGPPGASGLACATVTPQTIPCAATVPDADGDGVGDLIDTCVNVADATQADSNLEGIGTICDPDYNDDGMVDNVDYEVFINAFGSSTGGPNFNPDVDHNGDGVIGIPDFLTISSLFGGPPGPAGAGAGVTRSVATSTLCADVGCP